VISKKVFKFYKKYIAQKLLFLSPFLPFSLSPFLFLLFFAVGILFFLKSTRRAAYFPFHVRIEIKSS